jgi:hypothetical protein
LVALAIYFCTTLPFLHDIITEKGTGIKNWVPNIGIEEFFKNAESKKVNGFSSYRTFIYFFLLHLFAAIGWIGWHKDSTGKPYKFLLLVPAILTLYTCLLILFDAKGSKFNEPGTKLIIAFIITASISIVFFTKYYKKHK